MKKIFLTSLPLALFLCLSLTQTSYAKKNKGPFSEGKLLAMSYSCFDILTAKEDLVYRACENRSMFIAEGNRLQQFVQGQKIKFSIGKNEKKMWIYNEQKQKAFKTKKPIYRNKQHCHFV